MATYWQQEAERLIAENAALRAETRQARKDRAMYAGLATLAICVMIGALIV